MATWHNGGNHCPLCSYSPPISQALNTSQILGISRTKLDRGVHFLKHMRNGCGWHLVGKDINFNLSLDLSPNDIYISNLQALNVLILILNMNHDRMNWYSTGETKLSVVPNQHNYTFDMTGCITREIQYRLTDDVDLSLVCCCFLQGRSSTDLQMILRCTLKLKAMRIARNCRMACIRYFFGLLNGN